MKVNPLAAEVGAILKGLRELHRLRQDDVARAARRTGLPWTRSMVVALEAGRRDLTIDEFVRLPWMLSLLDITTDVFEVWLRSQGTTAEMRVGHRHVPPQDITAPGWASGDEAARVSYATNLAFPWTHGERELRPAYEAAGGDLELKVGRQYKLPSLVIALIAQSTWGRSLTEERDRRVAEQAKPGTTPRVIQALRGHAARALREELHPMLVEAQRRGRRSKGSRR